MKIQIVNIARIRIVSIALFATLGAALVITGCSSKGFLNNTSGNFVKPTIAVMKFENRAPFPLGWDLSSGMRDILVDRLVATGRYHVIERPEIDSILRELRFQHSGMTRQQRRAALGRLKNVQYLVKGTITDFGHVSTGRGFLGLPNLNIFGGSHRAVMSMTLYVVDVESGEIICSKSIEKSVRASDTSVKVFYKDVAFGGSVFYRTPLGRATAAVIDKAVKQITAAIANQPWKPKIALVKDNQVIINGGADRKVRPGYLYEVFEPGPAIIDPDSGDCLGYQPGKIIGRIEIIRVHDRYSEAAIVLGKPEQFKAGQYCRFVEKTSAR